MNFQKKFLLERTEYYIVSSLLFSLLLDFAHDPICLYIEGRIHSAVVSGIDLTNHSLTVEWFERGETKGKEVQLCSKSFFIGRL